MNDLMSLGLHRAVEGVRHLDRAPAPRGAHSRRRERQRRTSRRSLGAPRRCRAARFGSPTSTAGCSSAAATGVLDDGLLAPAVQCDAERLPFASGYFDCVTVAFGLRNMTHKDAGAGGDDARAQARRPARGARVLEGVEAARARVRLLLVSRSCLGWASRWPATPRRIATSPNRSACIPTRPTLAGMMRTRGLLAGRSVQSRRGGGCRPSRRTEFDSIEGLLSRRS